MLLPDDALVRLEVRLHADDLAGSGVPLGVMPAREPELRPAPDRAPAAAALRSIFCHSCCLSEWPPQPTARDVLTLRS